MSRRLPRLPRPRLRIRGLIALVALVAVGLGAWRELTSEKWAVRRAIHEFAESGPDGEDIDYSPSFDLMWGPRLGQLDERDTIAELDRALVDVHPRVRLFAIRKVPQLAMGPGRAIERLLPLVHDPDAEVRATVVWSLLRVCGVPEATGPMADPASRAPLTESALVPAFLTLLDDPDPHVRRAAVLGFENLHLSGMLELGPRPGPPTRELLMTALARRLKDPDGLNRILAAGLLAFGDRRESAVLTLYWAWDSRLPGEGPRWQDHPAELGLSELAKHSDGIVRFLLSRAGRTDNDPRLHPLQILADAARSGPESRDRIRRLAGESLKSPDARTRGMAASLLDELAVEDAPEGPR